MGSAGGDLSEVDTMDVGSEVRMPEYRHYVYNVDITYLFINMNVLCIRMSQLKCSLILKKEQD